MTDMPERILASNCIDQQAWSPFDNLVAAAPYVRFDLPPKVRALEWAERTEGLWRADDPTGGCYEVIELSESRAACHHVVSGYGVNIGSTHQSVDDAKAASQAHYSARILAALVQA
jgi:hypothetical protein